MLTPHPGEAARLLGVSTAEILADVPGAAARIRRRYGAAVVLKGARSVLCAQEGLALNPFGTPAMAKGGSGDVLAGVVGSLAAQGYDLFDALTVGAFLHGRAGERLAARFGAHGALPSQLPEEIGRLLG